MDTSDLKVVRYDIDGGVALVTLDRPERLNAWTGRMHTEYRWVLAEAERDDRVRVIVVTGAGRAFCAGVDLGMPEDRITGRSPAEKTRNYYERFRWVHERFHVLADLPATSAQLADAAQNLDRSQAQLDALAVEFDRISAQMAAEDANLRGDLRNGASLLDTIAARQSRLQAEITYANQGLGAANAGLDGHQQDLAKLLIRMPSLQEHLRQLSNAADPALADINMCYPDIINAIAELASATSYRRAGTGTDANGYELRVQTFIAPAMNADTGSLNPPVAACVGGTPTP